MWDVLGTFRTVPGMFGQALPPLLQTVSSMFSPAGVYVCVWVVCVCVCARARARVCVCVCVLACKKMGRGLRVPATL